MTEHIIADYMHREDNDYFKNVGETEMLVWLPIILKHSAKCKHKNCIKFRKDTLTSVNALLSWAN